MSIVRTTLALALLATGCTFNADGAVAIAEDETSPEGVIALRCDATGADSISLSPDPTSVRATLLAHGIVPAGEADAANASLHVAIDVVDGIASVEHSIDPHYSELLDRGQLELAAPATLPVTLTLGSTSAHVDGMANVTIDGESGSVELTGGDVVEVTLVSGAIHAEARDATLTTVSGSMDIDVTEHVDATASTGSIEGRIAGGGSLRTGDGSMDLDIVGPLTEDLTIETGDGSVHLSLASGVGARLVLEPTGGSVAVNGGSFSFAGRDFEGEIGTAEHTITVRTGDGSIAIDAVEQGR